MSLATRCTHCGTVFRVVQDQLKVSEGWVRCGRCNEVFNALEGLFDLERDTPPAWKPDEPSAPQQPLQRTVTTAPQNPPPAAAAPPPRSAADFEALQLDRIDAQLLRGRHADDDSTPAQRVDERDRLEFPDARFDPDAVDADVDIHIDGQAINADTGHPHHPAQPMPGPGPGDAPMSIGGPDRLDPLAHVSPSMVGDAADTATELPPDFLRHAKRRQQRTRPLATALWTVTALLLAAGLGLQAVHYFRDGLAARWPITRPGFSAACLWLQCTIQPPRHIDEITVESSALARVAAPDAFKLSVGLRNRSTLPLALPSVELSLTDATGQLVARRVLQPADFHAAASAIAAGTDTALQLVFKADKLHVTGYTVEIFYP